MTRRRIPVTMNLSCKADKQIGLLHISTEILNTTIYAYRSTSRVYSVPNFVFLWLKLPDSNFGMRSDILTKCFRIF